MDVKFIRSSISLMRVPYVASLYVSIYYGLLQINYELWILCYLL